jgi:enoyl-CoA hydratase
MAGAVAYEVADGIALVTIDNPPANVLSGEVISGLEAVVAKIEAYPGVRAVVVTGAGEKFFVAGADIAEFEALRAVPGSIEERSAWSRTVFERIESLRQPVIAAVDGSAVGGGTELVLLCDLVIASEAARFGLAEVKIGLIPGGGGTQRLARRVGVGKALELVMLGELIDAAEAHRIGLVSRVVCAGRAVDAARIMASKLAALPAIAVQEGKAAVKAGLGLPLSEALDRERDHFLTAFGSSDFEEGYQAFLERREPVFTHALPAASGQHFDRSFGAG